jgi:glucose-1-phosphate thymidylyltransferase
MKGVILAGGLGTRLGNLTKVTNKHLLPIYDKPMIHYPITTLVEAKIEDILIIVSGPHAGHFLPILKNGEDYNCNISFAFQERPDGGIADALRLAKSFVGDENVCVILGDTTTDADIREEVDDFEQWSEATPKAQLFLKQVDDPRGFGVVVLNEYNDIVDIVEKPSNPPSNLAVTGVYLYDKNVFEFCEKCQPSHRGQLEITDVNKMYLRHGDISWFELMGFWQDAGTFENLFRANQYWHQKKNNGKHVDKGQIGKSPKQLSLIGIH